MSQPWRVEVVYHQHEGAPYATHPDVFVNGAQLTTMGEVHLTSGLDDLTTVTVTMPVSSIRCEDDATDCDCAGREVRT